MIHDPVLIREWHVVAQAGALGEGAVRGARLMGEDVVLWRSGGQVHAWQDLCAHRGAKLSLGKVVDGHHLRCPYHGWTYDGTGGCVLMPAHPTQMPPPRARARAYSCREAYGWIWVCLADDPAPLPEFPEWGKDGYQTVLQGPAPIQALGPRVIENFLDLSHLPIVHAGTLGDPSHAEIGRYEVSASPHPVSARGIRIWQPDPDGTGQGQECAYAYDVLRPLAAYLTKETSGGRLTIMITATPVDESRSLACLTFAVRAETAVAEKDFVFWADGILNQDIPIVESQRPERLPLDLQAELHLPSDRTSIAYRQWLRRSGVTFGTA
jgi:phenylpropionate dioxygenase-like ring-hydroxylating dioxygenase large terminal subunit